jgi:hypothetical protein
MNQRVWIIKDKAIRANAAKAVSEITGDPLMEVIVRPYKEDKTAEQRGWFHVLCGIFGGELGYSPLEVKELIKAETFGETTVTIGGITKEVVKSSESAKRDEYSQLIEAIYRVASSVGVQLPPPRYNGD